jgi:prepilin-type processing-associated H-X9-DG protein
MEQSPLYDQISALIELDINQAPNPTTSTNGKPTIGWFNFAALNPGISATNVSAFLCPSAPKRLGTTGIMVYMPTYPTPGNNNSMSITGWFYGAGSAQANNLGKTNYFLCLGGAGQFPEVNAWYPWAGYFWNRSRTNFGENVDGTSNTIFAGESPGGYTQATVNDPWVKAYDHCWIGAGTLPAAWGPPAGNGKNGYYQFGSFHPGAVQYAFADGAVRPVALTVTRNDLINVAGRQDAPQFDSQAFQ